MGDREHDHDPEAPIIYALCAVSTLPFIVAVFIHGKDIGACTTIFVVAPRTMEQRLTRARQRLRERGDPAGAPPEQSLDRLDAVLRTLYLLFNEG